MKTSLSRSSSPPEFASTPKKSRKKVRKATRITKFWTVTTQQYKFSQNVGD
jgi:hypothetical protein